MERKDGKGRKPAAAGEDLRLLMLIFNRASHELQQLFLFESVDM